jgi:phosphoribosylglycinamide formyltransferase-1
MRAPVAVLASGAGTNLGALIYASRAEDCPYEIVLVSGDNEAAPALRLAEAEGIDVAPLQYAKEARDLFWQALDNCLRIAEVEIIVLAGFMRIIPADFISKWENRIINIHPSLLPLYKGLNTHAQAIENGDTHGGCTVHVVTPEVDSGVVLGQTEVIIMEDDTPETLAARVRLAEHQLLPRVLAHYIQIMRLT